MRVHRVLGALTLCAIAGAPASAAIVSTSGDTVVLNNAPASVHFGEMEAPTSAYVFQERSNIVLDHNMVSDLCHPGTYVGSFAPLDELLESGELDSYYVHADPSDGAYTFTGTITFDKEIVGVFFADGSLDATDAIFGSELTDYEGGRYGRGTLEGVRDVITISEDRKTITFELRAGGTSGDQFRVVTANAVPAPGALALVGLGGLVATRRRR